MKSKYFSKIRTSHLTVLNVKRKVFINLKFGSTQTLFQCVVLASKS